MKVGRIIGWAVTGLFLFAPINWARIDLTEGLPKGTTTGQILIATTIAWLIGGGLAYLMVVTGRKGKIRDEQLRIEKIEAHQRHEQAIQALIDQPLEPIYPKQALMKTGESAFASAHAVLQEEKTVGFSAGTSGVSVRVAKGVTLRKSGSRGHAVKKVLGVSNGELVVTNKRVVFAGDRKSFSMSLTELVNVTNYSDGIGLHGDKVTHSLAIDNNAERKMFEITLNKVLREFQ